MCSHYFLFLPLFLITNAYCALEPLPDERSSRLSLAQCIAEASTTFFLVGEIILISLPVNEVSINQTSATVLSQLLFDELFRLSHWPVMIVNPTNVRVDESYQKYVDNYIILVRQKLELNQNLEKLEQYSSWNPHAKFLVVSASVYEDNAVAASSFIQQLWLHKVSNGIILLPNKDNKTVFDAYSWFPFKDGNCGNNFHKLHIIDRCSFGKIENGHDWFSNKIPKNLNGCPVRVRTVLWPPYVLPPIKKIPNTVDEYQFSDGLEIQLINTMAEAANFQVVYTMSDNIQDWGYITTNGSADGLMLHIKNEQSDIGISAFASSVDTHRYFDVVTYPMPESLKWCVAKAEMIPSWKYFFNVIQPETYFCLILAYFAVTICMWKLSAFQPEESTSYKTFQSCAQNIFGAMFNVSINIAPRSHILRILFLIWIFFSLHVNVAYQTYLMNVFSKPQYEHQIDTVEEIFSNNLLLWLLPTHKRFFKDNEDQVSINVMQKWNNCKDIRKCLHSTAYEKKAATCTPRLYLRYISNLYVDREGNSLLHCFKENIATFPQQMIMRKGFPFRGHFTNLVGWIAAAGLIVQWEKNIFEYIEEEDLADIQEKNAELFTIGIHHLILLFVMLGASYVAGLVVLLVEIYYDKKKISQLQFLN